MAASDCLIAGCARPVKARGLCRPHYEQTHRKKRDRPERVLRNRARSRALTMLAERYPADFRALEAIAYVQVTQENEALRETLDAGAEVVPLRSGPRGEADDPIDRVATSIRRLCPTCATFHEQGHGCPTCTARKTSESPTRARIRRMLVEGKPVPWIVAQGESLAEVRLVVAELIAERVQGASRG